MCRMIYFNLISDVRIGIDIYIKYQKKICTAKKYSYTFFKHNFRPKKNFPDATYQLSLRYPSFINYSIEAERYLEYEEVEGEFFNKKKS